MNKYKVKIVQKDTYCVDVLARDEEAAKKKAAKKWNAIADAGIYHYYQTGDTETEFSSVYDVTSTDDPFNP